MEPQLNGIWPQAGLRPASEWTAVRVWSLAGLRPASNLSSTNLEPVCDQLRTCLWPASSGFELSRQIWFEAGHRLVRSWSRTC